jgi:hypothetical protein
LGACGASHETIQNARRIIGQGQGWIDPFLRPAAVPVVAIPLAFRRTASRAVEATNGPAGSKPDMDIPSPPLKLHRPKKFSAKRDSHLRLLGRESTPGNGSIR